MFCPHWGDDLKPEHKKAINITIMGLTTHIGGQTPTFWNRLRRETSFRLRTDSLMCNYREQQSQMKDEHKQQTYQLNININVLLSSTGWYIICQNLACISCSSGFFWSMDGSSRWGEIVLRLTSAAFSNIFIESFIRPLLMSQRGDSGMHLCQKNKNNSSKQYLYLCQLVSPSGNWKRCCLIACLSNLTQLMFWQTI